MEQFYWKPNSKAISISPKWFGIPDWTSTSVCLVVRLCISRWCDLLCLSLWTDQLFRLNECEFKLAWIGEQNKNYFIHIFNAKQRFFKIILWLLLLLLLYIGLKHFYEMPVVERLIAEASAKKTSEHKQVEIENRRQRQTASKNIVGNNKSHYPYDNNWFHINSTETTSK